MFVDRRRLDDWLDRGDGRATETSLQPWVEDALVKLHARNNVSMNSNYTPWTIEEDRLLLSACCTFTRAARRSLRFA